MPIYEFECETCGCKKEILMANSNDLGKLGKPGCDKCKKVMRKVISASNFHLKGGGWYKDGYGNTMPSGRDKK